MRAKDALGRYGEELAVEHLRRQGMTIVARNWRCAAGELDVIARDGGTVNVEAAQEDMAALCSGFALPRIANTGPQPTQIIIVLSDREVAFGETVPEATQYFEAYSLADGMCVWEPF